MVTIIKSGIANLPLHGGNCPRWLFPRMKKLAGAISEIIVDEYGTEDFLKKLSDPFWFQSLGCVIGFDWHSSGLTTTTLGALKESINQNNLGIKIAGGKGKMSRKAPHEIEQFSDFFNITENKKNKLEYSSKMSAKVDNALVQDGYQLYHHNFVFDEKSNWIVIQQGMNNENNYARRYHWSSNSFSDYIVEPHSAICCDSNNNSALDLTSKNNNEIRKISVDLVNDDIDHLSKCFNNFKIIKNRGF